MLRYNVLYNAGNAPQKFSCLRMGSLVGKARSREQIMGGGGGGEGGVGAGGKEGLGKGWGRGLLFTG